MKGLSGAAVVVLGLVVLSLVALGFPGPDLNSPDLNLSQKRANPDRIRTATPTSPKPDNNPTGQTGVSSADSRIVLVSGRDDHGLLEEPHVNLYRLPETTAGVAGVVEDGSFARVLEVRGNWLRIQSLLPPNSTGWVDDYYLRGKALRTDGGGQVRFAAARYLADRTLMIAVYPLGQNEGTLTWLPSSQLREVGAGR